MQNNADSFISAWNELICSIVENTPPIKFIVYKGLDIIERLCNKLIKIK